MLLNRGNYYVKVAEDIVTIYFPLRPGSYTWNIDTISSKYPSYRALFYYNPTIRGFQSHASHDSPKEATTDTLEKKIVREFCQKHYEKLLSFMAKRSHNEKLKDVRSRLSYSESTNERQRENEREYRRRERDATSERKSDEPLESEDSAERRQWKRHSRKASRKADNDLSEIHHPFTGGSMSLSFLRESNAKLSSTIYCSWDDEISNKGESSHYYERKSQNAGNSDGVSANRPSLKNIKRQGCISPGVSKTISYAERRANKGREESHV
ncbi:hypothetical protein Tco_1128331 [Tanacetum coccineum]